MLKQLKNPIFLSALSLCLGLHSYTIGSEESTNSRATQDKTDDKASRKPSTEANVSFYLFPRAKTRQVKEQETPKIENQEEVGKKALRKPLLEVKGGYFLFSDSKMRKIYDRGGIDVQLSTSCPIWKWLQMYASIEYMQIEGRTLGGHEKTKIWEVPLSLGLQPVAVISPTVHYYLTIGPRYFFVHQHNYSHYLSKNVGNNGLGGFVNTGFYFFPCKHLLLDVFGEYSYKRMHFHSHKSHVYGEKTQVGGFVFGLGIGCVF